MIGAEFRHNGVDLSVNGGYFGLTAIGAPDGLSIMTASTEAPFLPPTYLLNRVARPAAGFRSYVLLFHLERAD